MKNLMLAGVVSLVLLLSGCGTEKYVRAGNALEERALDYSSTFGCNEMDIGLWIREFGSSPRKAEAWAVLCGRSLTNLPGRNDSDGKI